MSEILSSSPLLDLTSKYSPSMMLRTSTFTCKILGKRKSAEAERTFRRSQINKDLSKIFNGFNVCVVSLAFFFNGLKDTKPCQSD